MKASPDNSAFPIIRLDETTSTNLYLSRLCDGQSGSVAEYTTVTARFQSAGKGQRGNSWESEKDRNLLFSVVLYPAFLEPRRQFILAQIASLAVKEELDKRADGFCIKWPNDIYYHERKIAGILIENELTGRALSRCICGIGLNVNQETFTGGTPNPVSLKQITEQEHDCDGLLTDILRSLRDYYEGLRTEEPRAFADRVNACYARSLFRRCGYHMYEDSAGRFRARLLRVEPDGRLMLEDENGRERGYLFKEVRHVL